MEAWQRQDLCFQGKGLGYSVLMAELNEWVWTPGSHLRASCPFSKTATFLPGPRAVLPLGMEMPGKGWQLYEWHLNLEVL